VNCFAADILKANDEVIRVMALYEDTVHRPDVDSLLLDSTNEADAGRGQCTVHVYDISVCLHKSLLSLVSPMWAPAAVVLC